MYGIKRFMKFIKLQVYAQVFTVHRCTFGCCRYLM